MAGPWRSRRRSGMVARCYRYSKCEIYFGREKEMEKEKKLNVRKEIPPEEISNQFTSNSVTVIPFLSGDLLRQPHTPAPVPADQRY